MNWQKWIGVIACIFLLASTFMHWAYYPDLSKYFTGFDSRVFYNGRSMNYYGRPGVFISILAILGFFCHLLPKNWAKRVNLIFSAVCFAYALRCYITFGAAYSGFVPQKEAGIYLVVLSAFGNLISAMFSKAYPAKSE